MNKGKAIDHTGSSFDRFLEEDGILEETEAKALKRVIAWQLQQAMKARGVTKYAMAKRLRTSRSQVDRLLDPGNVGVSLATLSKAVRVVGKRIVFEVVDENGGDQKRGRRSAKRAL
jgi:antitoxin HicB